MFSSVCVQSFPVFGNTVEANQEAARLRAIEEEREDRRRGEADEASSADPVGATLHVVWAVHSRSEVVVFGFEMNSVPLQSVSLEQSRSDDEPAGRDSHWPTLQVV